MPKKLLDMSGQISVPKPECFGAFWWHFPYLTKPPFKVTNRRPQGRYNLPRYVVFVLPKLLASENPLSPTAKSQVVVPKKGAFGEPAKAQVLVSNENQLRPNVALLALKGRKVPTAIGARHMQKTRKATLETLGWWELESHPQKKRHNIFCGVTQFKRSRKSGHTRIRGWF